MNDMERSDEKNNTQWRRRRKNADAGVDADVNEGIESDQKENKKKIEIYNPNAEILPILEGPETINTSTPSTLTSLPPILSSSPTSPQYKILENDTSTTIKEGFDVSEDIAVITDTESIIKNPLKWLVDVVIIPIKYCAKIKPTAITHNKYTAKFLRNLAEKDIANGWLDQASTLAENIKNKITNTKIPSEDDVSAAADAAASQIQNIKNKISGKGGILSQLKNGVKCGDEPKKTDPDEEEIHNPELELDMALIKDYMFKTILLVVSFFTVSSWAYLFLVHYSKESGFFQKIIDDVINGSSMPSIEETIPIRGFKIVIQALFYFFNLFKPFDMAARGINTIAGILQDVCAYDMNKLYDKKIWYIIIFYCVFLSTTFFIGNYERYMKDIANFKKNNITTIFFGIFVLYYIYDVFTYPTQLKNITEMSIGAFVAIPFLIFLLLRNIFVLICLYYNQFLFLFLLLILFIAISIFGLGLFPVFNPGKMFERFKKLRDTINNDVMEKLKKDNDDPNPNIFIRIYRIIRNILHFSYDHLFTIISILWILYMYRVFDRDLKNDILRMNVFTMLALSILILVLIKLLKVLLFSKRSTAHNAAASAAP